MLKNLTQGLSHIIKKARGQGRLSEENIKDALAQMRTVLLEADVALPVVDEFLDALRQNVIGKKLTLRSIPVNLLPPLCNVS